MTETIYRYVRHHDVPRYANLGWSVIESRNQQTHHDYWSAVMRWDGVGEPREPDADGHSSPTGQLPWAIVDGIEKAAASWLMLWGVWRSFGGSPDGAVERDLRAAEERLRSAIAALPVPEGRQ